MSEIATPMTFSTPTTTVDFRSIFPFYGIPVGAATAISNLIKSINDIAKIILSSFLLYRGNTPDIRGTHSLEWVKAMHDLRHHLTFFAIGILRMVPVLGGAIAWIINTRTAFLAMMAAQQALSKGDKNRAIQCYKEFIHLNGSPEAVCAIGEIYASLDFSQEQNRPFKQAALEWVKAAAGMGSMHALTVLGDFYHDGTVVEKDFSKALDCYKQAAESGYSPGQSSCGLMLLYREGIRPELLPADEEGNRLLDQAAIDLLKKAAAQGDKFANYHLGLKSLTGAVGVEQSKKNAFKHFMAAAQRGLPEALVRVGKMCLEGDGLDEQDQPLPANSQKAMQIAGSCLIMAAKQGHPEANFLVAKFGIAEAPNEDPSLRGKRLFFAARHGIAEAQLMMGMMCLSGQGLDENGQPIPAQNPVAAAAEAKAWIDKAIANELPEAMLVYAGLNEVFLQAGIPIDPAQSMRLLCKLIADPATPPVILIQAEFTLGMQYLKGQALNVNGEIIPPGTEDAIFSAYPWIEKAANKGFVPAKMILADFKKDPVEKVRLLNEVIANADPQIPDIIREQARFKLGLLFMQLDFPRNIPKGVQLIQEAADKGFPLAKEFIKTSFFKFGKVYITVMTKMEDPATTPEEIIQLEYLLGKMYLEGGGVNANGEELPPGSRAAKAAAYPWMEKAARKGHPDAMLEFGKLQKSEAAAYQWIEQAARLGHMEAQLAFAELQKNILEHDHLMWKMIKDKTVPIEMRRKAKFKLALTYMRRDFPIGYDKGIEMINQLSRRGFQPAVKFQKTFAYGFGSLCKNHSFVRIPMIILKGMLGS